jgi:hypothetical protein
MSGAALSAPMLAAVTNAAGVRFHAGWTLGVAGAVFALAYTRVLLVAYALYALTMSALQLQLCLVQAQSALLLPSADYSTLFGVSTTATLLLQSGQQVILQVLGDEPSRQYTFVACWALAVAALGVVSLPTAEEEWRHARPPDWVARTPVQTWMSECN